MLSRARAAFLSKEAIALVGLGLLVAGVHMIYRPAAYITAGLLVFVYAYVTAK